MSTALIITNNLDNKPINAMYYGWSGSTPAAIAELQNIILYMRTNKKVHIKDEFNCLFFELSKGVDKYYRDSFQYIKKFDIGNDEGDVYASKLKPTRAEIVFTEDEIETCQNYATHHIEIDWKITDNVLDIDNSIVIIQSLLKPHQGKFEQNTLLRIPLKTKISDLNELIEELEKAYWNNLHLTNGKYVYELVL